MLSKLAKSAAVVGLATEIGAMDSSFEFQQTQISEYATINGRGSKRVVSHTPSTNTFGVYATSWSVATEEYKLTKLTEITNANFADHGYIVGDYESGDRIVIRGSAGNVYLYDLDWTSYSLLQTLSAPSDLGSVTTTNFANNMALDMSNAGRSIAVACTACNSNVGEIHVYDAKKPFDEYERTDKVTVPATINAGTTSLQFFAADGLAIYDDVLVSTVFEITGSSANERAYIFEKDGEHWSQSQVLRPLNDVYRVAVWEDTIVATVPNDDAAYVYRSNRPGQPFGNKPEPKHAPQWSLQQTLKVVDNVGAFGWDISFDKDTLFVGKLGDAGDTGVYVYKRPERNGAFSHLQTLFETNDAFMTVPYGKDGDVLTGGQNNGDIVTHFYSESVSWDCLRVDLKDKFGDGWGNARLAVDGPDGKRDHFGLVIDSSDCSGGERFSFRYCPNDESMAGLYKFSLVGAKEEPFNWEIFYTVMEESTGNTYTGDHATKMDFNWDPKTNSFARRGIFHDLPSNSTCHSCPPKPKTKPAPRKLAGATPSPTGDFGEWQYFVMDLSDREWFAPEHEGSYFYISDIEGRHLLREGTSCDLEDVDGASCWQVLPDGEYVLRVTGALNPNSGSNSWTFCNVAGSSDEEMTFRIADGMCSEIVPKHKNTYHCLTGLVDYVTLVTGEIVLQGLGVNKVSGDIAFTSVEESVISEAIHSVLSTVDASDVSVGTYYGVDDDLVVSFTMKVSTLKNGVTSLEYVDQKNMLGSVEDSLIAAAENGLVYRKMYQLAASSHSSLMTSLGGVVVQNLAIGTTTMSFDQDALAARYPETSASINYVPVAGVVDTTSVATEETSNYTLLASVAGMIGAAVLIVAAAMYAFMNNSKKSTSAVTHTPVATDVELTPTPVKTAPVVNAAKSGRGKAAAGLDKSMMEGLVRMVQDEDAALANAMNAGHFN